MNVQIKALDGRRVKLSGLQSHTTVKEMKEMIQVKRNCGITAHHFPLAFKSVQTSFTCVCQHMDHGVGCSSCGCVSTIIVVAYHCACPACHGCLEEESDTCC
jgi:hypothetical protein